MLVLAMKCFESIDYLKSMFLVPSRAFATELSQQSRYCLVSIREVTNSFTGLCESTSNWFSSKSDLGLGHEPEIFEKFLSSLLIQLRLPSINIFTCKLLGL
jgi:hypothetical protein